MQTTPPISRAPEILGRPLSLRDKPEQSRRLSKTSTGKSAEHVSIASNQEARAENLFLLTYASRQLEARGQVHQEPLEPRERRTCERLGEEVGDVAVRLHVREREDARFNVVPRLELRAVLGDEVVEAGVPRLLGGNGPWWSMLSSSITVLERLPGSCS